MISIIYLQGTVAMEKRDNPTPRAEKLREQYFSALSSVSTDFPYWYTRKYNELEGEIPVIRRAEALKFAFSHIPTRIWPGELLVGGKTHHYRGSFPMPWLSEGYFVAQSGNLGNAKNTSREQAKNSADELSKIGSGGGNVTKSFGNIVSIAGKFGIRAEETVPLLKIANQWVGKSVEDLSRKYEKHLPESELKDNLMRSLVCMFDSGYTIPLGREVINYYFPLQYGYDGLLKIARDRKAEVAGKADGDGLIGMDRLYFYEAVSLLIEGVQSWHLNYAKEARRLSKIVKNETQRAELYEIAQIMENIAHKQPASFREALQMTYMIHIAALNEEVISGMSPGRLGQVLFPWFEQDIAAGAISEEQVIELFECYRVKMTCIDCFASMGVVGGVLSGNTFNNLSLGGLTKDGQSAVNWLEYLILKSGVSCQTTQPTLSVLYDEKLPEEFLLQGIEANKTGTGYPAWMNNRSAIEFLVRQYAKEGMSLEEARAVAIGGCLETSPCSWFKLTLNGKSYSIPGGSGQPTSVGVHFIAVPKVLELTLMNGYDNRNNLQILPPHNMPLSTYSELWEAFTKYFELTIDSLVKANNIQHDIWRKINPGIFNSLLKPNCLEKGQHIGNMGYRYNATYNIETCGQINLINSLAAIKQLVYDEKKYSLDQLREGIMANFGHKTPQQIGKFSLNVQEKSETFENYAQLFADCKRAPKYGNDDNYVDSILRVYENFFLELCTRKESLYGKPMYSCQISVSTHGPQGAATLASADGRLSGTTYADGSMSAYPGTDKNGPYALFQSATCWDQSKSQNSQLNLKVHPLSVKGKEGSRKLLELTRAYLRNGGFHVQYNVVESSTLLEAQEHPENYRDLMVRVAGFTQYWVELGKPIQDEVIARTEYEKF
ncbi:MAG: 4-hydroxyphenylacetate decarboxylase large subunit [Candidatus Riflebacteria bacterium]|nr:4-hydroxyphenylacetate decarboxylase large subunit [Candidatus Riflebacteria bacterium]